MQGFCSMCYFYYVLYGFCVHFQGGFLIIIIEIMKLTLCFKLSIPLFIQHEIIGNID